MDTTVNATSSALDGVNLVCTQSRLRAYQSLMQSARQVVMQGPYTLPTQNQAAPKVRRETANATTSLFKRSLLTARVVPVEPLGGVSEFRSDGTHGMQQLAAAIANGLSQTDAGVPVQ
eukprot:scaffold505744_cov26-Prasinocladus_malaysianus.AAC.1